MNPQTRRQRRTRTILAALTTPVAVVAAGALVYQASWSAFTASTTSPGNTWDSGTVNLVSEGQGTAAFTVENIAPGATGTKCILVTATTGPASTVTFTSTPTSAKPLNPHIALNVSRKEATGAETCTSASGAAVTVATGTAETLTVSTPTFPVPAKSPNDTTRYAFTFTWTFTPVGVVENTLQGLGAGTTFTWNLATN